LPFGSLTLLANSILKGKGTPVVKRYFTIYSVVLVVIPTLRIPGIQGFEKQ